MEQLNTEHQPGAPDPVGVLENVGWVRSLALQLAGHPILADDIAQETWVRVLRNPAPNGVSFRQWVVGTMRRVVKETQRQSHRRRERETIVSREKLRDRGAELQRQVDIEREVVARVMDLREPLRRTLLARYYEVKSVEEIAAEEGVSVSAVRSRMSKAYAELRARLTEKPGSPAGAFFCMALGGHAASTTSGTAMGSASKSIGWKATACATLILAGGAATWVLGGDRSLAVPTAAPSGSVTEPSSEGHAAALVVPTNAPGGHQPIRRVPAVDLNGPPAATIEVAAQEDFGSFRFRVLDDLGNEVSGIPVAVRWTARRGNFFIGWSGVSGSNGEPVTVPMEALGRIFPQESHGVEAYVLGVGLNLTPLILDGLDLPADPVDLVISEPFGSLELEFIDASGRALSEWVDVCGKERNSFVGGDGPRSSAAPGQTAILKPVGLNAPVAIMATARSGWGAGLRNATGPAVRGEVKPLRVDFVNRLPTVAFRLGTVSGEPLPEEAILDVFFTPDSPGATHQRATLEDLGEQRFVATFGRTLLAGVSGNLRISVIPGLGYPEFDGGQGGPLLAAMPVTLEAASDRLDLGLVTVGQDSAPFRGVVLDAAGEPVAGALIWTMRWDTTGSQLGWSHEHGQLRVVSGDDGRFELSPTPFDAPLAIMAASGVDRASRPVALTDASQSLELTLRPCAELSGNITLPEGVDPSKYWVVVAGSDEPELRRDFSILGEDGGFRFFNRTDRSVTLELRARGGRAALATRHDVAVSLEGGPQDALITPWDVRTEVRSLTLSVLLPSGEPAERASVRVFRGAHSLRGQGQTLLVPIEDTGLTVNVTGCQQFSGRTASLPSPIQLEPGFQVDLEIHAGPETASFLEGVKVSLFRTNILPAPDRNHLDDDGWLEEASKTRWTKRLPVELGEATRYVCHQPGEYFLRFREIAGEYSNRVIPDDSIPAALRAARVEVIDTDTVQTVRFDWP